METNTQISRVEIIGKPKLIDRDSRSVVLGCLSVAVIALTLLYRDINSSGTAGKGPAVAKLLRREARVRRKPNESFTWLNLETDQKLYRKDSLQTGSGGAAVIELTKTHSILEIGENSLIVLDDTKDIALNFMEGTVVVHGATGDQALSKDKEGKVKVVQIATRLTAPEPLARTYLRGSDDRIAIVFQWETPGNDASAADRDLEVSTDSAFSPVKTKRVSLEKGDHKTSVKLPPGAYYWRIVGRETHADVPPSSTRQFRIVAARTPQGVWPINGEKLANYGAESTVEFRWSNPSDFESTGEYRIDVAADSGFKNIEITKPLDPSTGSIALNGLPHGKHYWRIHADYSNEAVDSSSEKFVTTEPDKIAVESGQPANGDTLDDSGALSFSWRCQEQSVEFQFELQTEQGKSIAASKTANTIFAWKDTRPGTYRWHVTATRAGRVVGESTWRTVNIVAGGPVDLKAPEKGQKMEYEDQPTGFRLEWKKDSLASKPGFTYQVLVSKDTDFHRLATTRKTMATEIESSDLILPPGRYFWRVEVVNSARVLKSSPVWDFEFGPRPALPAPTKAEPGSDVTFNPVREKKNPVIGWSAVDGAEKYEVVVYGAATRDLASAREETGDSVVYSTTTAKRSIELKNLKEGQYTWTVRAISKSNRKGSSMAPNRLNLNYGRPLSAPKSKAPEVQ